MPGEVAVDLTEAHRLAQLRVGARSVAQLRTVWPLLDPEDLDATFPLWVSAVQPIVEANRSQSAELAGAFYTALRQFTIGEAAQHVVRAGPVDPRALVTSMLVTGPISIRSNLARMTLTQAADVAEARTSGAAMRHVLNGGRETLMETVKADPRSGRWQRVTSGNACDFCSMLEDRGAVYSDDTADFEAHDGCGCTAEPVFN